MVREESSGYNIHDGARSCVVSYTLSYGGTFGVVCCICGIDMSELHDGSTRSYDVVRYIVSCGGIFCCVVDLVEFVVML